MTALLTLEEARPSEVFTAAGYQPDPVESQIGLRPGERMAVRDLLVALLLESANDAAVTLAEGIAGDTRAFVDEMNERADRLGLDDTSYANPIGFDDPGNYSTASDLALLARRLMETPRFRDMVEEPALDLGSGEVPRTVENRNELVGDPLVDGIKTGHTLGAGYVLVGSAAEGGNRVISVVLGAPSEAARDGESELLSTGSTSFRTGVVRPGEPGRGRRHRPRRRTSGAHRERWRRGDRSPRGGRATGRCTAEIEGPLAAGEEVGSVALVHRAVLRGCR